jgi:L-threonylcarbamoyladenylate synthase
MSAKLAAAVDAAARRLAEGGVVIYPTETFYGLGAAINRPEALRRVAALKGREGARPMPIIAADELAATALYAQIPEGARILMHRFWPGPLTLVLPARPGLPMEVVARGEVGVRVSSHPIATELARRVGPIVATSANPRDAGERARVAQIDRRLLEAVDAVIDAGETHGGKSSTVLRFVEGRPVVLREGAIQKVLIDACLPPSG